MDIMWSVLLLLGFMPQTHAQDSTHFTVRCDPSYVVADVGSDANFSCQVESSVNNLTDETVKWSFEKTKKVFVWRGEHEIPEDQDENFKGRVRIQKEGLIKGKIVLTISKITLKDNGTYTCLVNIHNKSTNVDHITLHVRTEGQGDNIRALSTTTSSPLTVTTSVTPTADSTWGIIGGVIGAVALIGLIGLIVVFILCKKKKLPRCCSGGNTDERPRDLELQSLQDGGNDDNPQLQEDGPAPADNQQNVVQDHRPPAQNDDNINEEQQPLQGSGGQGGGKRKGKRVQPPDSLVDDAVPQSTGPGTQTLQPPPEGNILKRPRDWRAGSAVTPKALRARRPEQMFPMEGRGALMTSPTAFTTRRRLTQH